ncbi:uncharacterized protein [Miscanthus floridulus]|uniref:uncharacterized protein n=1 Tax=Miscanthus floridulus TaxID=154761 RepID=UPI0034589715
MAAANRLAAEQDKKAREQMKKAKRLRQEARDRGEDVSSEDEDNDDDDDDEVAVGMDWDVLEDEDTLTSGHPSVQGPFPFHAEGSESMRSVEASESAASHGVPAKDWWVEESRPTTANPKAMGEGSGSGAVPHEMMEGSDSGATPHETMEGSGSGAAPHETMEGSGSSATPHEVSLPTPEQGVGSKRSRPDESGQGSGDPFLRTGHPLGLAPKKSLTIQVGQMASPGVTPVLGRSDADVGAALADPTASVVAPTPTEVTERAASSMADVEQPAEGRIPPVEKVDEDVEVVHSLRAKLSIAVSQRLSAENVSVKLEKEAAYAQRALQVESDEHDLLQAVVEVVLNALNVTEPVETSPLMARAAGITAWVGQLKESAFHAGITQAFTVTHAHYEK